MWKDPKISHLKVKWQLVSVSCIDFEFLYYSKNSLFTSTHCVVHSKQSLRIKRYNKTSHFLFGQPCATAVARYTCRTLKRVSTHIHTPQSVNVVCRTADPKKLVIFHRVYALCMRRKPDASKRTRLAWDFQRGRWQTPLYCFVSQCSSNPHHKQNHISKAAANDKSCSHRWRTSTNVDCVSVVCE